MLCGITSPAVVVVVVVSSCRRRSQVKAGDVDDKFFDERRTVSQIKVAGESLYLISRILEVCCPKSCREFRGRGWGRPNCNNFPISDSLRVYSYPTSAHSALLSASHSFPFIHLPSPGVRVDGDIKKFRIKTPTNAKECATNTGNITGLRWRDERRWREFKLPERIIKKMDSHKVG